MLTTLLPGRKFVMKKYLTILVTLNCVVFGLNLTPAQADSNLFMVKAKGDTIYLNDYIELENYWKVQIQVGGRWKKVSKARNKIIDKRPTVKVAPVIVEAIPEQGEKSKKIYISGERIELLKNQFSSTNFAGIMIASSGALQLIVLNREFKGDIMYEYDEFLDEQEKIQNIAFVLLVIGGILILLD